MKDEILNRGYVDVKVFVSGLRQSHRLHVVKEKTSQGMMTLLVSQHYIPTNELLKLSEQFQLPIKHKGTVVFPRGKMARDFTEREGMDLEFEQETVEAEMEEDSPEI